LREKIAQYDVQLEYLFPVNQTNCFGEVIEEDISNLENNQEDLKASPTTAFEDDGELLYD